QLRPRSRALRTVAAGIASLPGALGSVDVPRGALRPREIAGAGAAALRLGPKSPRPSPSNPGPHGPDGGVLQRRQSGLNARARGTRDCLIRPQETRPPRSPVWAGPKSDVPCLRGGGPLVAWVPKPGKSARPRGCRPGCGAGPSHQPSAGALLRYDGPSVLL